ncbi:MAG: SoxR reducing system RseC family protein [Bacillota bacterium]
MEQYGEIIENREDIALVNLQRHLICGECGKCGIMSGATKRNITIEAHNPIKAKEGQKVRIESDDRQVIFLAFMLYIVPLAGLMGGILLWFQLAGRFSIAGSQELQAFAVGMAMMVVIFLMIRNWDRRVKNDPRYKPVITGLLLDKNDCNDQLEPEIKN